MKIEKIFQFIKDHMPDETDIFTFGGIGLIGTGTWFLNRPISLIVVGGLFLILALMPYIAALIKPGK